MASAMLAAVWPPVKDGNLYQPRNCFGRHLRTRLPMNQLAASAQSAQLLDQQITLRTATTANDQLHEADLDFEIRRLVKMGDIEKVAEMISDMHVRGRRLAPGTYLIALELCTECKALKEGKRILQFMSSFGISLEEDLGLKLVNMYIKSGDLVQGRKVFDGIAHKEKPLIWNLFLNEYAKIRDYGQVAALLVQMRALHIEIDSHAVTCVLKCAAEMGNIESGKQIHGYALKTGCDAYVSVANALILMYCKCGCMEAAIKVFYGMQDRDVVSWNSLISGYLTNQRFYEAVGALRNMWFAGIHIDAVSLVSALPALAKLGALLQGKALHAHAIKNRYRDLNLSNCLINMYNKCGDLGSAIKIFEKMDHRNVVSWTTIISAYSQTANFKGIIDYLDMMKMENVKPDEFLLTTALQACASCKSLDQGRYINNLILEQKTEFSLPVSNALINMYAKCGSMDEARAVFDGMVNKDAISWNSMIGGYSKNHLPNEALCLFREMLLHMKPDHFTMSCILPATASLFSVEKGKEIHGYMLRNGTFSDGIIANALLDMYTKCGALSTAEKLFHHIVLKDTISWTIMVAGYGIQGQGKEAIATFKKMRRAKFEPTETSFVAILNACSQSKLVEEGWIFFDIMRNEYEVQPKLEHYASMVDLLSRAGQLTKAYKFIMSMPITPDSKIWGALLYGCRVHRNVILAEKVAEYIFKLEPGNTMYYTLLANIYAEDEKWEAVKKLNNSIEKRRLQKNECSWIELRGKTHTFFAGDRTIPQLYRIKSFLADVARHLKVNGEESRHPKKTLEICHHTEKLATAFGVLNISSGKPIRVVKNTRVCNHCHDAVKCISLFAGREIILRDPNCFHHFVNGQCSCRGYW